MYDLPSRARAVACAAVLALMSLVGCAPASSAAVPAAATPRPTETGQATQPTAAPTVTATTTPAEPAPTRIEFAPGGTDYYTEGKLAANEVRPYVLRARKAQQMDIDVDSPEQNVGLTIVGASDGNPLAGGAGSAARWNGELPETQDYIVRVAGPPSPATYALMVSIPARVELPAGTTSTTVRGKTQSVTTYLVAVRAGQTLSARVTSPRSDVVLSLHGVADGVPFITLVTDAASWSGVVTAAQDYAVSLVATTGPSDYELNVAIE
jgi:hypothetical protein